MAARGKKTMWEGEKKKGGVREGDVVGCWMHLRGTHAHTLREEIYQRFILTEFDTKLLVRFYQKKNKGKFTIRELF